MKKGAEEVPKKLDDRLKDIFKKTQANPSMIMVYALDNYNKLVPFSDGLEQKQA